MTFSTSSVKPRVEHRMSEELEQSSDEEVIIPSKDQLLDMIDGKDVDLSTEPAEPSPDAEPEYTEVEQQAMEQGWKPDGAEGKRNLSAEEFLDRKPLYDRAHKQDKQIKSMQEAIDAMVQQNKSISEREYNRALADLEAKMGDAVDNMDKEAATEVSKEIAALEASKPSPEKPADPNEPPQDFLDFLEDNSWYNLQSDDYDVDKSIYADAIGKQIQARNPDLPVKEMLDQVASKVQEKFKPTNPNRDKAAPVASSNPSKPKPKAKTLADLELSPEEEKIARTIIRGGVSEEDYIKMYS